MNRSAIILAGLAAFLVGLATGVLGTLAVLSMRDVAAGMYKWGSPQVYLGQDALREIEDCGFSPGDQARDTYCYVDGFQDRTVFLAYSDTREHLGVAVEQKTGKAIHDLPAWTGQIARDDDRYGPGHHEPAYRTSLYDLTQVGDAVFHEQADATSGWYLVYDRQNNRLYYCSWDT